MKLADALERVQVPVLLQTGWQDLFLPQTLEQYQRLSARGIDVGLTVGPWTHISMMTKGGRRILTEALDWFGEHLGGSGTRTRAAPVSVFVTGADQWRDLAAGRRRRRSGAAPPAGWRPRRRAGADRQRHVVHLRPRRPHALDRRPAARREGWRLQGRPRPRRAARRGRLHRRAARRAARRPRLPRCSSWRTAPTTRTPICSCGSPR